MVSFEKNFSGRAGLQIRLQVDLGHLVRVDNHGILI